MKYKVYFSNRVRKDIETARKQSKNIKLLFDVIGLLSNGQILDKKFKDHPLSGKYDGKRECHIEPDFLLIYQIYEKFLLLEVLRVGTHSNLFQ